MLTAHNQDKKVVGDSSCRRKKDRGLFGTLTAFKTKKNKKFGSFKTNISLD